MKHHLTLLALVAATAVACAPAPPTDTSITWCGAVPRSANEAFERVKVASPWFDVYRVAPGVFAIVEANQFQEAISYVITGTRRALMFDTGIGLVSIRPVVEELTSLPVTVINSHTHFDHVGGNTEFDSVLAVDTAYTRQNQAGFPHENLRSEVAPSSFCHGAPVGADTATFRTKPWRASGTVRDGHRIDLGGRTIEVLQVPGHTPDALALRDSANGLLWTGDSFYEAPIWLFVPETDLDAYERSLERLVSLAPSLTRLLPAHNVIASDPARLAVTLGALRKVKRGEVRGTDQPGNQVTFTVDGVTLLTSRALLQRRAGRDSTDSAGVAKH